MRSRRVSGYNIGGLSDVCVTLSSKTHNMMVAVVTFALHKLILILVVNQVYCDSFSSPNPRAGDVIDKFELDMGSSGPKSSLFSECQALANTIEGSLYSVPISENIEYLRFAPLQSRAMEWTELTIDGDTGVLACILKAAELMAWMVKYEGKCLATFSDVYNSTEEQSCDNPQEVVYVITDANLAIDYSRGKDGVWRWPGGEEKSFPWVEQPEDYHDCALGNN
ncbi:uncharacterized protein LOC108676079 [Hyalella azteca]|uniref:Uncharacterized protein LOC108676079 n=1 Tax=Hyalella azteca TaxID=294128 RepID=A0A8B7P0X3_HYAAZ|nr:uncharacterized protein LOC108676079 [Hyalella azteca]